MDLAGVRMALADYDSAPSRHERDKAEKRLRRLFTVGLIRTLLAAVDDPNRPGLEADTDNDRVYEYDDE